MLHHGVVYVCVQDVLEEIKAERRERAELGGSAPYQRTIP